MHEAQRAGAAVRRYETPSRVEDALALLARHGARARLVAGGTDLLLELARRRHPGVEVLVDVTRIPGLDGIREDSTGWIHLGPLVTHAQVVRSDLLVARALPLAQACLEIGSPQVRTRATVAGNLLTAAPGSDTASALAALGARLRLRSTRSERICRVEDLGAGKDGDARPRPDEMLMDLALPALGPGRRGLFVKLRARQGQATPLANLAVLLGLDEADRIASAALVIGGLGPAPREATAAAARLVGSPLDDAAIAEAARLAAAASEGGEHGEDGKDAGYRREMVAVMTRRALRALRDGAERAAWPQPPVTLFGTRHDGRFPTGARYAASHDDTTPIVATVNGRPVRAPGAGHGTLLAWLREELGLTGTKSGCAEGVCGACTVWLDGAAVLACLVPAPRAHGAEIVTIEGLARDGTPHPLQEAFVACGAVQCGFCTPGFVMAGASLLAERSAPTRAEVEAAYAGNLCRCTGYHAMLRAVARASSHTAEESARGDRAE